MLQLLLCPSSVCLGPPSHPCPNRDPVYARGHHSIHPHRDPVYVRGHRPTQYKQRSSVCSEPPLHPPPYRDPVYAWGHHSIPAPPPSHIETKCMLGGHGPANSPIERSHVCSDPPFRPPPYRNMVCWLVLNRSKSSLSSVVFHQKLGNPGHMLGLEHVNVQHFTS